MEENENPTILIVDDRPENLLVMEVNFEDEPCSIVTALSGNEALSLTLVHDFAVVLMDVQMPGMDGFETAELMRSNHKTANVPIIFVTAISKEKKHLFKGYESGAVDYIFKPLEPVILKSKVNVFLNLYNQKKKLEKAKLKILEQQKKIVEEERLKVLLNMAGATAHELNQPLMALIGNIDLIEMSKGKPEKIYELLENIKKSGIRISKVVKKIQSIRRYDIKPHDSQKDIVDINQRVKILCIENSDEDFFRIKESISDHKEISLLHVTSVKDAGTMIGPENMTDFDLIFLDFILDDGTGFDFLTIAAKQECQIPIVVITGQGDEVISAKLIQAGACDYLPKSRISKSSIARVISNALEKAQLKMDLRRMQTRLVETSTRDELTGLFNRRYFFEALGCEIERAGRYNENLTLLMIDIDHFKQVNDTYGHPTGDIVLAGVAKIFMSIVRQSDFVGRVGGEEFCMILTHTDVQQALLAGEKIRKAVEEAEFSDSTTIVNVTVSIGISGYDSAETTETLIKKADSALYFAKTNGRNQVHT